MSEPVDAQAEAEALAHAVETITPRTYQHIFFALMILLGLTVVVSLVPFHRWHAAWVGVVVAMSIAIIKAVMVVLYFMHVKVSSRLTKIFVIAGVFWLGILVALTLSDYLTRDWLPYSKDWIPQRVVAENPAVGEKR